MYWNGLFQSKLCKILRSVTLGVLLSSIFHNLIRRKAWHSQARILVLRLVLDAPIIDNFFCFHSSQVRLVFCIVASGQSLLCTFVRSGSRDRMAETPYYTWVLEQFLFLAPFHFLCHMLDVSVKLFRSSSFGSRMR